LEKLKASSSVFSHEAMKPNKALELGSDYRGLEKDAQTAKYPATPRRHLINSSSSNRYMPGKKYSRKDDAGKRRMKGGGWYSK